MRQSGLISIHISHALLTIHSQFSIIQSQHFRVDHSEYLLSPHAQFNHEYKFILLCWSGVYGHIGQNDWISEERVLQSVLSNHCQRTNDNQNTEIKIIIIYFFMCLLRLKYI